MDFKGLRWAGNIYERFEAMCLEVEEVMYEDTVKYVENQVQKVGVSVKKFYSEVMQDLAPPEFVDPVKVAAGDLPLNPYAHTGISKKLKPSILDNHQEVDKKKTEDEVMYNVTTEKKSSLSNLNDVSPHSAPSGDSVQNNCSELYSVRSKKIGVYRRPIGIKRISQNRCPSKTSHNGPFLSGDSASKLEHAKRSSCLVNSDIKNATSSFDPSDRHVPAEVLNRNTSTSTSEHTSSTSDRIVSDESVGKIEDSSDQVSLSSEKILSSEFKQQKNDESACSSSWQGLTIECIGSRVKDDTCEDQSVDEVTMPDASASTKDGTDFQLNSKFRSNAWHVESASDDTTMSCEDNFDMEVIENEEVAELGADIFEPVGNSKMDESCVLVDVNNLHSVPLGIGKNKSYKKKIREALSSKLRSTKKQDQIVSRDKDVAKNNVEEGVPMDSDKIKRPHHDSLESEWELL